VFDFQGSLLEALNKKSQDEKLTLYLKNPASTPEAPRRGRENTRPTTLFIQNRYAKLKLLVKHAHINVDLIKYRKPILIPFVIFNLIAKNYLNK